MDVVNVAIGIGLVVALLVVNYGSVRGAGWIATRVVDSTRWRLRVPRTVLQLLLLATVFGAIGLTTFYSPLPFVVDALGTGPAGTLGNVTFAAAWTTGIVVLGEGALKRGLEPTLDATGAREPYHHAAYGLGDRYRQHLFRAELVFFAAIVWLFYALVAVEPDALGGLIPVIALSFFGFMWWARPCGPVSVARVREPTADERSRIEECYDRTEWTVPTVFVFDDSDTKIGITVEGNHRLPTLWIGESMLDTLDDDALTVATDQAERRDRARVIGYPLAGVAAIVAAGSLLLVGLLESSLYLKAGVLVAFVVSGLAMFGLFRAARRKVYAIDRDVAARFGPEAVREAYSVAGEKLHFLEDGWHEDHEEGASMTYEPSVSSRIQALVEEESTDENSPDGSGPA